jgi:hypothetical protein
MIGGTIELMETPGTVSGAMTKVREVSGGCFTGSAAATTGAPSGAMMSAKETSWTPTSCDSVE